MCGIAGVVASGRRATAHARLEELGAALAHRGPDGSGVWTTPDRRIALVHRRLAIIDPDPRSDQPMRSTDGTLTLTYNGELYNHRELRSELERRGRRFRTTSDTEVLLESLAEWGTDALRRLRGMFAFALHDARTDEVLLVRDALGIKPLYHALTSEGDRVFASEVRALRPLTRSALDPTAAIDLLLWGSIAAPRTSVAGVRALPAGHLLRIGPDRTTEERWAPAVDWTPSDDGDDPAGRLVASIRDSVRAHLVADVPVAVFLSSGVDSGVIASIAAAEGEITALTVRDPDADESGGAAALARRLDVPHVIVDVPEHDAAAMATAALTALDQPSVDGVNSFVIARAAMQAGFRVALSGVGGDELFGGYPSATRLPALGHLHRTLAPFGRAPAALLHRPAGRGWDRGRRVGRARWVAAHAGLPHGPYLVVRGVFAPAEVAALLDVGHAQVMDVAVERLSEIPVAPTAGAYASAAEATQYLRHQLLRDIDATSMASSLEVRTPLVDAPLLTTAAAIPQTIRTAGPAKSVLRAAARHDLPGPVGPKRGFSVPMERWVRDGTLPLEAAGEAAPGATGRRLARRVIAEARAGRAHWSRAWLLQALGLERRGGHTHD